MEWLPATDVLDAEHLSVGVLGEGNENTPMLLKARLEGNHVRVQLPQTLAEGRYWFVMHGFGQVGTESCRGFRQRLADIQERVAAPFEVQQ